jgi:DNA-binding NtrC family response regulator
VVEFFVKPLDFKDLERFFAHALQKCCEAAGEQSFSISFIGGSVLMRPVFQSIAQACVSAQPVIVRGADGSGRSHVAHLIHEHNEGGGSFVGVDCARFQGDWHRIVESARGGSIVLDGIDQLSLQSQVMLEPVVAASMGVKWMAVCKKEGLLAAVREHAFHLDLYYRLQGVEVILPSLRERIEDLRALCSLFLAELAPSRNLVLEEAVYEALEGNGWKGNLKELKSVLHYAVITSEMRSIITLEDFPLAYRVGEVRERRGFEKQLEYWVEAWFTETNPEYRHIHDDLERMLLEILLDRFDGNQASMARSLEMNRATLRKRLKRDAE